MAKRFDHGELASGRDPRKHSVVLCCHWLGGCMVSRLFREA